LNKPDYFNSVYIFYIKLKTDTEYEMKTINKLSHWLSWVTQRFMEYISLLLEINAWRFQ